MEVALHREFWRKVDRLAPPRGRYYCIHFVNCYVCKKLGITPRRMLHSIANLGLYAPQNYATLTFSPLNNFGPGEDYMSYGAVFHTWTKATEEPGAFRNSPFNGYNFGDILSESISRNETPEIVQQIFPDTSSFVRVESSNLVGTIQCPNDMVITAYNQQDKIADSFVNGAISRKTAVDLITQVLRESGIFNILDLTQEPTVLEGMANNCLDIALRKKAFDAYYFEFVRPSGGNS